MIALVALNAGFLVAGCALLWGLRAIETPAEAAQLAGVSYLTGVAAVVLLALELVIAGVRFDVSLLVSLGAVAVAGLGLRRLLRPGDARAALRPGRSWLLALVVVVPLVVYLVQFTRLAPHLGVWEPDAVTTWTMRAKSLYFANGLDLDTLRSAGALAYPLYESALQAAAFFALGGANDLAFHVQFAILLLAFLGAVAGVASRAGAPGLAIWPFVALFAVTPEVQSRGLSPLADLTLDYFFATGALLLVLWLERRESWALPAAAILLAAAISTKREGLLLAFVAFAALLPFCLRLGRVQLGRLLVAGACAVATFVPWRIWIAVHDSSTDIGNLSPSALRPSAAQLGPAARLLGDRTFSYGAWLLVVPIAVALAGVALLSRDRARRRPAAYFCLAGVLAFFGFLAIWWLVPDLQTAANQEQPAVRLAGALVALSTAFAPLLAAWSTSGRAPEDLDSGLRLVVDRDDGAAVTRHLR